MVDAVYVRLHAHGYSDLTFFRRLSHVLGWCRVTASTMCEMRSGLRFRLCDRKPITPVKFEQTVEGSKEVCHHSRGTESLIALVWKKEEEVSDHFAIATKSEKIVA
jgi:hypothetical protein